MKKKIILMLCILTLMLLPSASADSPVKIALLEHYDIEGEGLYLILAFEGPEESTWKLVTENAEAVDSEAYNYRVASWPEEVGKMHRMLVFRGIDAEYTIDDLALSVSYTVGEGTEVTELYPDFGERIAADARSKYGLYDFGGFCGYISEAFVNTVDPFVEIELRIKWINFSDYPPTALYTNVAEQFQFYAKDGSPLNEALGCSMFEVISSGSAYVTYRGKLQFEGRFDDDNIKEMVADSFGYVEYIKDNGESMRPEIQYVQYYRGNGDFELVNIQN